MWFQLKGDERTQRCATERCGGQPTWRMESGGVGSNYCSGCKARIEDDNAHCREEFLENVRTGGLP
jgi:hypothetical protein